MKKLVLFVFIANFTLFGDEAFAASNEKVKCDTIQNKKNAEFTVECDSENKNFKFKLAGNVSADEASISEDGKSDFAKTLYTRKIYIENSNGIKQEFNVQGYLYEDEYKSNSVMDGTIELVDLNFDGYNDIKLLTGIATHDNKNFECWIYNQKAQKFIYSDIGEKISSNEINLNKEEQTISIKVVYTSYVEEIVYKWFDKKLKVKSKSVDGYTNYGFPPLEKDYDSVGYIHKTSHYNDAEQLISVDIEPAYNDDPSDVKQLLGVLKKKQNDYLINEKDDSHFSVIYKKSH